VFADDVVHRIAHRQHTKEKSLTERIDHIVTHKIWSWPITLALFVALFWITISGAEIAGGWLDAFFSWLIPTIRTGLTSLQAPWWVTGALVDGFLVGVGTVITVMLPPMIILFIAFALLEDLGLLPRVAFNLDRPMQFWGRRASRHSRGACRLAAM